MQLSDPIFLIVIVGPTAVGKTDVSIQIAERIGGEIISADSRLFYRGMDIGTAKPSISDRRRVFHHLIDVANLDEVWSVARFHQNARLAIENIHSIGKLPILVGGSGQFIRAVIDEWNIPVQAPNVQLRHDLEKFGNEIGPKELHRRLTILDPAAAKRIEPNNLRRSVRALEVMLLTGARFSEQKQKSPSPYHLCIIGLNRSRVELFLRVDNRIMDMISTGFVEEVSELLSSGYSLDLPAFSAIGYRELAAYLRGKLTLNEAVVLIKRYTRQFIRRQANWFKPSDPSIKWFDLSEVDVEEIVTYIQRERFPALNP